MIQQLYIDGQLADIAEDTNVTFSIVSNLLTGAADFKGNRSLTIALPATVRNRSIINMAQVVQGGGSYPYTFHNVDYYRNGVAIIQGGIGRLVSATPDKLNIAIVWGVRTAVEALLGSDKTLASLPTTAAIRFHNASEVTDYEDALVDDVFYAAMDTELHEGENAYYHTHVVIGSDTYNYTEEQPASALLHPSVRMNWILSLMESQYGVHIEWGDAMDDIDRMIVPLVKKIPNDTTYNYGFTASTSEPNGGNKIRFSITHASPIISQSVPEVLTCATAFTGLAKYSLVLYINEADLVPVSRPIMRAKYGYSIGLLVGSTWHWCPIMPEGYTFLADKITGGRLTLYVSGYLNIEMAVDDVLMLAIGTTRNGIFDPNTAGDIHVQGGPLFIAEIIGKENEVQPDQMFPVEGNLPDIKPIDLVKFLAAVTGVFPVQASTTDTLVMCPVASVFDWSRIVDWSGRLLSPTARPVAANKAYAVDGWAQRNWWKWKDDDTVLGNYDGSIDVDDETLENDRDVVTFPFAATDGNNVPLYTKEVKQGGVVETKYKAVQPRVLNLIEGSSGEAVGMFDMDMKRILSDYYGDLAATMQQPSVITETIHITDVELSQVDETRPIYIKQHGAFFALLELNVKGNHTAEAKLLKLTKRQEEE